MFPFRPFLDRPRLRRYRWWIAGFILLCVPLVPVFISDRGQDSVPLTEIITMAQESSIDEIAVDGEILTVTLLAGTQNEVGPLKSRLPPNADAIQLLQLLHAYGVEIGTDGVSVVYEQPTLMASYLGYLFTMAVPVALGVLIYMVWPLFRTMFKHTDVGDARLEHASIVGFGDVAGHAESKEEVQEVVEFLKRPGRFWQLGARVPRGILLVGPPGTGKTLMARAIAGESGVPFFHISASELVELYVGAGAARVRDLFRKAKKVAPSIMFIDEIDAVGGARGGLNSHSERDQTLNQVLVEMDGFANNTNVIVIAATNRPDMLDPALLRPGRFDRRVTLGLPDVTDRADILGVHVAGKPLAPALSLEDLALATPGFSGADLANLVNEAAILCARRSQAEISRSEFDESIDRIIAGPEKRNRVISSSEKKLIAYHEAGHALVAWRLPYADRVHKISIVARGDTGGHTTLLPVGDRVIWTKRQFQDILAVAMGGRAAEELVFDELTTGAADDFERATRIASDMVRKYGMSREMGPRTFVGPELSPLQNRAGNGLDGRHEYGSDTAQAIDAEVQDLVTEAYGRAEQVLRQFREKLDEVACYLVQHEAVSGGDLERLLVGGLATPS